MAFLINCDNRKCLEVQAALLNTETNEVICSACGEIIKNITVFSKRQLKSLGQTIKNNKKQEKFSTKCFSCNTTATPKLVENNYVCSFCQKPLNLTASFEKLLAEHLSNE